MNNKSPIPNFQDEEAAPPAYTETHQPSTQYQFQSQPQYHPDANTTNPYPSPTSPTSQYYSHQINTQLRTITTEIKSTTAQKSLLANARDEQILSLLTTQIQIYLSSFAKTGLRRGTLILIPEKGLSDGSAVPVDYDFRDEQAFDCLVRVGGGKGEGKERREFGDGDGGDWFWGDGEMAKRLAGYLRPVRDARELELPPRKPVAVSPEESPSGSSRGFWGRKKSTTSKPVERPVLDERRAEKIESREAGREDRVVMDVEAEEVVFRTENDFGIYETQRGWGIVLKLRVTLGR